ncbi:EexN family lipoprotein [Roseomonas mucosa]|uniref:EexN family lipoprotein n=1 Tax=Roseomonas mucosa TaxID=207340 RepID=UPI00224859AE|nr:EexN family lipoprotein [Roseomonas mucosa]
MSGRRALVAVVVLAATATASFGAGMAYAGSNGEAGASPPRTVTWYADNPQSRARVEMACLDDPGHLSNNADCRNAHQAAVMVAVREARSRTAPMDTNSPAFWASNPEARRNKILLCRTSPQLDGCSAARRSLVIEAGQGR